MWQQSRFRIPRGCDDELLATASLQRMRRTQFYMPCGGISRGSLNLVSALLLPSVGLNLSLGTDMDGTCRLSGLLTLEVTVSRVVTVCFSVRLSRSSVDLMLFVRGLPDNVLLWARRSGAGAGEFGPASWVLDSKDEFLVAVS